MQPVWFLEGWHEHVLHAIRDSLDAELHEWIEWPMRQVHSP